MPDLRTNNVVVTKSISTMSHAHHHHSHSHHEAKHGRAFAIGIVLNTIFIVVEVVYGLMANSSALLADAGHNLTDVLSLAFAWGAMWLGGRKPGGKFTYGFRRTTILVSLLNALLIFAAVIIVGIEAIDKITHLTPVSGNTVMIVAAIGILINGATAMLFFNGQKNDLNVKGAYLHMMADAAVSLGVVLGGLAIKLTGAYWIDPVISFAIIIAIVISTWQLFTESVNLALDAVPSGIQLEAVRDYLLSVKGVEDVHDLHIWAMSTTQNALTVHLVCPAGSDDQLLGEIREQLHDRFRIEHTTIQVELSSNQAAHHQDCGM